MAGQLTRAYVQHQVDGPLSLEEVLLPDPTGHEILVAIESAALCQSQLYWMHSAGNRPELHGHEGYGTVIAVGPAVTSAAPGDHVVLSWIPGRAPDGRLPVPTVLEVGGRTVRSHNVHCWASHTLVDELFVMAVPPGARTPEVAIMGCAVPTGGGAVLTEPGPAAVSSIAVVGLGGVGLSAVAVAAMAGIERITAVDVRDEALDLALQVGATETLSSRAVGAGHAPEGLDMVVDCVTTQATVEAGLDWLRAGTIGGSRGGTLKLVGAPRTAISIDAMDLMMSEKRIVGCRGGSIAQPEISALMDQVATGALDIATIVTRRFGFDDLPAVLTEFERGGVLGRALMVL